VKFPKPEIQRRLARDVTSGRGDDLRDAAASVARGVGAYRWLVAAARIIEWVRQIDRDGWDCVIMADEPGNGAPWQGRYAFDPQSIRARATDQPPADPAGAG
jgi:hypothetical protein